MDQTLTNKKFIEQMDSVITKLGGTPVDLELTEDQEDDMVLNGVFASKIDEVIKALGGTPAEISVAENNMVSNAAFQVKMEDVVNNMESGGGGGDFNSANVTLIPTHGSDFGVYDAGYNEYPWGRHCFHLSNGQIVAGGPSVSEETTITLYYIGDSLEVQPNNTYESSTGAVTWDPDTFTLTITGDCTITGWTSG